MMNWKEKGLYKTAYLNSILGLINNFLKFTELNLSIKSEYTSDNVLIEC